MIQELIEKLLQEEADEANHKGWCDTEISKTLKDRDYRLRDITDLHSSIEKLNARKEKLNLTKTELTEEIAVLARRFSWPHCSPHALRLLALSLFRKSSSTLKLSVWSVASL